MINMGCCGSKEFEISSIEGQGPEVLEYATVHGMKKGDVNEIYRKFCEYDVRGNSQVDVDEFIVALGLQPELFLMLVFRLFDSNMEGSVIFSEFMMAYYQFLTLDKDSLAIFTFSLFDLDGSQTLDREEIELMMRVLEGKVSRNDSLAYKVLDLDGDGNVGLEEFLIMASKRPNMMFLAFETQMALRSSCMSVSRWEELTKRRRQLMSDGSKHHGHVGFTEIMGWDPNRKHVSSQYAFLALKHVKGLPKGIKAKVEEAEHRINLVKREKQKQRELKEKQLANQRKAITEGKKHQEEIASKYEAMKHGNSSGPYDHVGARHTHSMTAGKVDILSERTHLSHEHTGPDGVDHQHLETGGSHRGGHDKDHKERHGHTSHKNEENERNHSHHHNKPASKHSSSSHAHGKVGAV